MSYSGLVSKYWLTPLTTQIANVTQSSSGANSNSAWQRVVKFFATDFAFAILLSAVLVALRITLFDFHFVKGHMVPNHDMSQAVSFFATNMHSIRLTGDLAFWNPASANGYAQYFQSFLSPLAPTPNHIAFILWAEAIRALSFVRVAIPEYGQYIAFTYVLTPFLTFVAGTLFFRQIYENRAVVATLMIAYAFSSIGIWNSAWFYFQESFTLFAVLGTSIAFLKKPVLSRFWLLLAAFLVQVCSANYWTVHNSWLYVIAAASYAFAFPNQIRRAGKRISQAVSTNRKLVAGVASLLILTAAVWTLCLGSIFVEQSKRYVRPTIATGAAEQYKTQAVLSRVHELRRSTVEFFNPNLDKALKFYQYESDVHNARYIGLVFLPFLFILPFYPWRRKERLIAGLSFGILLVCLGFPLVAMLWTATPMLSRDQHLFYFYTQYLQVAVIMGAAAALEVVLSKRSNLLTNRRLTSAMLCVVGASFLGFAGYNLMSGNFPAKDMNLETALYALTLVLVVSGFAAQHLLSGKDASRRMLLAVVLSVALLDLTTYYAHVSEKDAAFSHAYLLVKRYRTQAHEPAYAAVRITPIEPREQGREISQHKAQTSKPWKIQDDQSFTAGLFKNMPVFTDFWPVDRFLEPTKIVDFKHAPLAVQEHEFLSPPLQLASYVDPRYDKVSDDSYKFVNDDPKLDEMPEAGVERLDASALPSDKFVPNFNYKFERWAYNDFNIKLNAPASGTLLVHQLADPFWKIMLDGKSVKPTESRLIDMTLPLSSGEHSLQMSYQPLARKLYWPAAALLQISLLVLLFASYRSRKSR